MARAVLVVSRYPGQPNRLEAYGKALSRKLAGDDVEPRPARFMHAEKIAAGLFNSTGEEPVHGTSIALGTLLDPADDWHVPGAPLPDGSFALLRCSDTHVELAADAVASRTIWYALTEQELIAASSQRAIVTLLGSFQPNRDALPWMLSAGTLGPTAAWDARIVRVLPGERVLLDRVQWQLRSTTTHLRFLADTALSPAAHLERLRAAVDAACARWRFPAARWPLALSGGADSRCLLYLLRDRGIEAVTWGLPEAAEQHGNDGLVAHTLARALGVRHRYFSLEPRADAADTVLTRFIAAGEGRVARISGYVDGFCLWRTLFEEGCHGVIRGDEAFGSITVRSEYAARWTAALTTLDDYLPSDEVATFELPQQRLPEYLARRADETLAAWRDRLYQQARVPTLLAGLTDLKTAYLDVATPLLSRSVLELARTLPDELRTGRRLWRELVAKQVPHVPLADRVAIPSLTAFLAERGVVEVMLEELVSREAAALFPPLARARLQGALRAALAGRPYEPAERPRGLAFGRPIPAKLRAVIRGWRRPHRLEPLVLAFRAVVATRVHRQLALDAATPLPLLNPAVNA